MNNVKIPEEVLRDFLFHSLRLLPFAGLPPYREAASDTIFFRAASASSGSLS